MEKRSNPNDEDHNESIHHQSKPIQRLNSPPINSSQLPSTSFTNHIPSNSNSFHSNVTATSSIPIKIGEDSSPEIAALKLPEQERNFFFNSPNLQSLSSANNYLSQSWRNALQMSALNMPSLPDYFTSVPMPSMPNITMPNLPSMPTLSMPSMPNLSMPNISMPNINFPSISDFMPFYLGKNIKSWEQIYASVREAKKKYTSVCPSLPFDFNFVHHTKREKLRIYFLASINSLETTLYYCDVDLLKNSTTHDNEDLLNFQSSNQTDFPIPIEHEQERNSQSHQQQKIKPEARSRSNSQTNIDIADCDVDIDDNASSSGSPTSMTLSTQSLSSINSDESYMNTSLLRQSYTSPTSSISNLDKIEWKPLITNLDELVNCPQQTNDNEESLQRASTSSQEEDLILQRKRIILNGIFSYDFHPKTARFVFTMKNVIYWFDDIAITETNPIEMNDENDAVKNVANSSPPYMPGKLINNDYIKLNATICPYQPDLVAYTADNDLWVCDLISGMEIRLTNTNYTKTAIMAGRPSFVMQEEFSRFIGFWWRPSYQNFRNVYTILCEFVDESVVERVSISGWGSMDEVHRFPKPGSTNAKSTLKLVHFAFINSLGRSTDRQIRLLKIEDLHVSFESIYPQYEYLIRCDWLNDDVIWAQLLNRQQNHLAIVLYSMADRFPSQIIHTESHHDHWYNCHEILYFFKNKSCIIDNDNRNNDEDVIVEGSKVEFLWSSEVTGFRHLYKIAVEIGEFPKKMQLMDDEKSMEKKNQESNHEVKARLLTNHQLTNGNWEVSESMYWVDQQNGLIYFLGTRDSPLENHLYVISSSQSSRIAPRRLSKEDFTHTRIVFDPEFRFCIDFQSNVSIPPFIYLHRLSAPTDNPSHINLEPQYIFLNLPDDIRVEDSMEYYEKVQILGPTPHLFECKLRSGELIYGFLFKPEFMEPGFKYPVLLEIYGGPEVQSVTKSFKDLRCHRRHLIASEGYIVVGFDSRGSKHRGVEFEKHIYKRLGQVEIDDQVEALQWLADNTGFIDMNRVAIHGWSFGGYLSLMALVKRPDVFKCAIAGAPVTNWLLYDTGYTERYMGLPSENEENYRRSSILSYIKHFPNEYNRLLIIHGLMDENVHFCHTAQLIQGLVMAGKPYQLSIYPYERHSLKKINSAEHVEATLIHYLQQNL